MTLPYLKIKYNIYISTYIMDTLFPIYQLNLPPEILSKIINIHKHNLLYPTYKKTFNILNQHLLYYTWLNKKINKKDTINLSILDTIKEFDYYKQSKYSKASTPYRLT
tara:strand:+ start:2856 stop:3179 length:324 start_codon:yes stop_codon:yes gene_type:complete